MTPLHFWKTVPVPYLPKAMIPAPDTMATPPFPALLPWIEQLLSTHQVIGTVRHSQDHQLCQPSRSTHRFVYKHGSSTPASNTRRPQVNDMCTYFPKAALAIFPEDPSAATTPPWTALFEDILLPLQVYSSTIAKHPRKHILLSPRERRVIKEFYAFKSSPNQVKRPTCQEQRQCRPGRPASKRETPGSKSADSPCTIVNHAVTV